MLRNLNEIRGYRLEARDGIIGSCKDFLFDDSQWGIRYLVADTAKWLPGRKVLISPLSLGRPSWRDQLLPVDLTKDQIKNSPPLEQDAPVSHQYELNWLEYYGHPHYWCCDRLWGIDHYLAVRDTQTAERSRVEDPEKTHLRSASEVKGYKIAARDGHIGHVEDYVIEDTAWLIRYLVVDTRDWLPGKKVLLAPVWIDAVNWAHRSVFTTRTRDEIAHSPEYRPDQPVNLAYESRLYDYYGRPVT
jgi:hypothetical protein